MNPFLEKSNSSNPLKKIKNIQFSILLAKIYDKPS